MRLDRPIQEVDDDATVFGGDLVTSAVSAHPGPAAAVLLAGAVAWFVRAGGMLGTLSDPPWTYGLVFLDAVLALVLVLNRGPAKTLVQLGLVLQLLATVWLARASPLSPVHWAYAAHAVVALTMVVGEPDQVRRFTGLGLGLGAAVASVALLALPMAGSFSAGSRQSLVGSELGYRLELPAGWGQLTREQLVPHLALPASTLSGGGVGFGTEAQGRYGLLWVERSPGVTAAGGCKALLQSLGGVPGPPRTRPAPPSLGSRALVYALRTPGGAQGSLGCGVLPDGRLVGLAVVASQDGEAQGEAAFAAVGEGLALQ
ncbi:zinc ribbon domain-containing protein [Pyxidicoccus xibeiensis]|uniref:zinc ribbon domain-containing protein n=1 Tax=Pyxidicoccus xibeiensis TaxID=2906759 RepID=UPI0020A7B49E|nr:zinc ribbon domain-containing protein [Pyxidicoccus xibeiensis]MCP3138472.1 zinc ribbon domain-containing protein [Pyxidicoccus xibeiensis]